MRLCVYHRYYCLSILDKHHHPDIDFEQGMKILDMCTDELKRRLPIDFKGVSIYLFIPLLLSLDPKCLSIVHY
jgi:hypothetical protein